MNQKISLDGIWSLRWFDGMRGGAINRMLAEEPDLTRALPARVPGEIHLDLIEAGILQEPTLGLNCLEARWVEETFWFYHRTFQAPALLAEEHAFLNFEGLDLTAQIYLNGIEIGQHANAFYPCHFEVSEYLRPGENTLIVALEAGLFSVSDRSAIGYGMSPDSLLHKRNWLRKTQSSFQWDWSPRLLNVGIHGSVNLEVFRGVRYESCVVLSELSDDLQTGTLTCRVFAEGLNGENCQAMLNVKISETGQTAAIPVTLHAGVQSVETQLILQNPALWWPVGHGSQPLYTVEVSLSAAGQVIGSASRRVGFRHVKVNQAPHPESGYYFVIEVNHKPIFVKGGNFVPADLILARLDQERYTMLVERALEANFNMLRVWGGGLYESDDFYNLCDEKGILVWQEFIFACAKFPIQDEKFLADVKREAAYQVRRLAHHTSLVIWCGNNEMEWGAHNWGYEKGVAHPDYALFHMVLPIILRQEDGTRYYQPSSPYSPDNLPPNQDDIGDQHPWSIGFADTDFRKYRAMACRFPNEGGTLGPTALPTMLACMPGSQPQDNPFNTASTFRQPFTWEVHDNSIAYNGEKIYPDQMLIQWLGRSIQSMTIEEYTYYGGILQGQGLEEYIRNFRRRMFDTSSAIFWMYNDCWPATRSWTVVDYYGRRTPSFYPVRRAFQPLRGALAVEDEKVKLFGLNEGPTWQGEVRFGLFALAGTYPIHFEKQVSLPANSATLLGEFPLAEWQLLGEKAYGAFALLSTAEGKEVSRDILFLPFYKEMTWPRANVRVQRKDGKAIFECDHFAWRVCLDLDGEQPLPDNFFDILPGIPTVLDWPQTMGEPRILHIGNLSM